MCAVWETWTGESRESGTCSRVSQTYHKSAKDQRATTKKRSSAPSPAQQIKKKQKLPLLMSDTVVSSQYENVCVEKKIEDQGGTLNPLPNPVSSTSTPPHRHRSRLSSLHLRSHSPALSADHAHDVRVPHGHGNHSSLQSLATAVSTGAGHGGHRHDPFANFDDDRAVSMALDEFELKHREDEEADDGVSVVGEFFFSFSLIQIARCLINR